MIQERKHMFFEAGLLRQRAADLEREAGEEEAGLIEAASNSESTVMEDDSQEVDSNYARTKVYSEALQ
jgi:hypothetical protein